MNSLGDVNPVVRVLHKAEPGGMTGPGAPGMSWSTVVASLRLHDGTVPRAQGQLCSQHVVAASGVQSFVGPRLSLFRRASLEERRWGRQDGGKADSGCDGPVFIAAGVCMESNDAVVVKCSVAHRKRRRRGKHLGRARRVRLLSPTPQVNP